MTYPSSVSFENKSTSSKDKNFDEVMDLNSYTTKKTATSGAIGFGLFSSNCEQLVSLIRIWDNLDALLLAKFVFVLVSMVLQVNIFFALLGQK